MQTGHAHHLPLPSAALVGRDGELKAVCNFLRNQVHLLTITGAPGIGKTRLAAAVAECVWDEFADGVFFLELAPITDPVLVPSTIARTLGVREAADKGLPDLLTQHIASRHLLLVLDTFEHLTDAKRLVGHLVAMCWNLEVLVTSRAALHLDGEHTFPLLPLAVPDPTVVHTPDSLASCPSVALFLDRAQKVNPDFGLTVRNVRTVGEICVRLEGVPLAIELAAAQVGALSSQGILERLERTGGLAAIGDADNLGRQRSLLASIEWSYQLLSPGEQRLFDRLSAFVGGFDPEAARGICAGAGLTDADIAGGLTTLADKSLIGSVQLTDRGRRFRLLEPLREYAASRLGDAAEQQQIHLRHALHFMGLAEDSEAGLVSVDQATWLARMDQELDNLRAALRWALDEREWETACRTAGALWRYWEIRGHISEGRRWLTEALAGAPHQTAWRAKVANAAGTLTFDQGDYLEARRLYEEGLAIRRALGDRRGVAASLNNLGNVALELGEYALARSLYEESLAIRRELGDKAGSAAPLFNLAVTATKQRDFATSRARSEECLALYRELGDAQGAADTLNELGSVALDQGDYARARATFDDCLAAYRTLGDKRGIARALHNLASTVLHQGDDALAGSSFEQALLIRRDLGDKRGIAECLEGLGGVAAARGRARRAAALFGAAEALREAMTAPLPPASRPEYDRHVSLARSRLDDAAFQEAWARGRSMALEEALSYALMAEAEGAILPLVAQLFGGFELRKGDSPIPREAWRRRRDRLLFSYLVLAGKPVARDDLVEALWPDLSPAIASASLHTSWSNLKRALEPNLPEGLPSAYLTLAEGRYAVDGKIVVTDVRRFEQILTLAGETDVLDTQVSHLEAAVALYRGDLLPEDANEPWTLVERERLRAAYVWTMERLAEGRLRQGRREDAVEALRTVIRLEPWREEAYCRLMRLLAEMGRRSEALHLYRECEVLLSRELGVAPTAETTALFEAIAAGRLT